MLQNRAFASGPVAFSTVFAPDNISTPSPLNVARTMPSLSTTATESVTFA